MRSPCKSSDFTRHYIQMQIENVKIRYGFPLTSSRRWNVGRSERCVELWCLIRPGVELKCVFVCVFRCCVWTWPKQTSMPWSLTFCNSTTWRPSVSEGRTWRLTCQCVWGPWRSCACSILHGSVGVQVCTCVREASLCSSSSPMREIPAAVSSHRGETLLALWSPCWNLMSSHRCCK